MTHDDVLDLLASIVAFEPRREIGEADIDAWGRAARLGRWSLDEACEAVATYELTAEWPIKVSDVHRGVRSRRQDRLERARVSNDPDDHVLLARFEAFADAKAVEHAPVVALPAASRDQRRGRSHAMDVLGDAMRRGEQARAEATRQTPATDETAAS